MYDLCDVLHASHGSADVISHVLCDYGEGNMGNGIRKLAGEILMVSSRESFRDGHIEGMIKGSIITACSFGAIVIGTWCIKRTIEFYRDERPKKDPSKF